ncbi:MAG: winged helix-turn-helix transcriptional regulator [Firmicutes bacterium]|nr:winged helix-turn-helix transcriptional regulator [Bacillota bacterium]
MSNEDLREQGTFFEIRDVRNFLKDIPGYRERLADVLSRCWNDWFKKSWSRIEEYEEEMLNKERLAFSHSDPIEYLKTFSSRVNVSEGRLVFQKDPDYSIAIKDIEELFIVSSVFSMPHTLANISGHRVNFVLNYDFRSIDLSYEINPETMLVLGAICDETRLRMMKILWDRDATTKEIAELLELSQSNISLHLKQMKEAGLVESSKVKRFVYYHLIKEPIMGIQDAITEYLSY